MNKIEDNETGLMADGNVDQLQVIRYQVRFQQLKDSTRTTIAGTCACRGT